MKAIFFSIILSLSSVFTFAQIKISGSDKVQTTTSNNKDVQLIKKEVDITRTQVEENKSTVIISKEIKNAEIITKDDAVDVNIDTTQNTQTEGEKIVIGLGEPTKTTTSTQSNVIEVGDNSIHKPKADGCCPPKPGACVKHNTWAIGLTGGLNHIQGDVNAKAGYGGSLNVTKGISKKAALRLQMSFGQAFGQDWKLKNNASSYQNYKTRFSDYSFQVLYALNQKGRDRFLINAFGGLGFLTKHSWTNSFDANGNLYDYTSITPPFEIKDKGNVLSSINDLHDNGYETIVATDQLRHHIKNTQILPSIAFGLNANIKLTKRLDLLVEHRVSWHNDDQLDNFAFNGGSDWLHLTSVGFNFVLGKNNSAVWWMPKKGACKTNSKECSSSKAGKSYQSTNNTNTSVSNSQSTKGNNGPIMESSSTEKEVKTPAQSIFNESNIIGYVFFDLNSSSVKQEYYTELYKLKDLFEQMPNAKIQIIGHYDANNQEKKNSQLSASRAESVYYLLTSILNLDKKHFESFAVTENNFKVPSGQQVNAQNNSEMNRSVTLIIK